jgi:hypothetical protein
MKRKHSLLPKHSVSKFISVTRWTKKSKRRSICIFIFVRTVVIQYPKVLLLSVIMPERTKLVFFLIIFHVTLKTCISCEVAVSGPNTTSWLLVSGWGKLFSKDHVRWKFLNLDRDVVTLVNGDSEARKI